MKPFIQKHWKPITTADTYTVKPMVKGTILTADFEVGDTVSKGDVLYTIDSSDVASSVEKAQLSLDQAQSSYDDAVDAQYIRSSVRGTVSSLKVKAGDVVSAGQEVAVVRDDSTLLLTLDFPAADAATYFVGQRVDVTIDGAAHGAVVTVQDTGIGIPPEHQSRIFERFYRVDKSHSKASGGTGLGLSIVKHAVAYHHGTIALKSEVGKGTEITVRFPQEK